MTSSLKGSHDTEPHSKNNSVRILAAYVNKVK